MFEAYEGEYRGARAVWLKAGPYAAAMLPGVGGNLVAFRDTERGHRYLHEPGSEEDWQAFLAFPAAHGIPVLFPPNRFEDGKFRWNGQTYRFPINEPATGNHLHGFLYNLPWRLEAYGTTEQEAYVAVSVSVDRSHPVYAHFPHVFTVRLLYTLSLRGLEQRVSVHNQGTAEMPCLLGFHTAVNAPFAEGGAAEDCRVKVTVGRRWAMNARMLPTGELLDLSPLERNLQETGIDPFAEAMDNHYTAEPQNGSNRMELTDRASGVKLVYETGASFKHWMIWNNGAARGFFCPEPQTCAVNAPNLNRSATDTGLIAIEPGASWEETCRMYAVPAPTPAASD